MKTIEGMVVQDADRLNASDPYTYAAYSLMADIKGMKCIIQTLNL